MQVKYCLDEQTVLVTATPGSVVVLFDAHEQEFAQTALQSIRGHTHELDHIIGLLSIRGSIQ